MAQLVKNPPAMLEAWVRSLGWEDPLEKGKATHFSILAWRITTDRGAWRATVHGITEWARTERLSTHIPYIFYYYILSLEFCCCCLIYLSVVTPDDTS